MPVMNPIDYTHVVASLGEEPVLCKLRKMKALALIGASNRGRLFIHSDITRNLERVYFRHGRGLYIMIDGRYSNLSGYAHVGHYYLLTNGR